MDRFLDMQLERLQTAHVDFYLVHTIQAPYWFRVKNAGLVDFPDQVQKDGRVKHVGFSFHDTPTLFHDVMNTNDWSFFPHVWNYPDLNFQAGSAGINRGRLMNVSGLIYLYAINEGAV